MGLYLNPGNEAFRQIRRSAYVDKSELIDFINSTIETPAKLTCFSRPRRFGKSFAAKMLSAYYDKSCDSRELFQELKISGMDSYEEYLNKFDVIYLDITRFISTTTSLSEIVKRIQVSVIEELREAYPSCIREKEEVLADALFAVSHNTGSKFILIIDEWDALFREAKDDEKLQKEYVQLLRGLFKGGPSTDETIAAAYMTGILPIKKYGTESALTDFQEFTMTRPAKLAGYVGFTEAEVKELCEKHHMDFESMQTWYDGYSFDRIQHVYNPNSVMLAIRNEEFQNYWTASETYESLKKYIEMDFDGLKDAIVSMLGGKAVRVKISTFQNDMTSFHSKDDVLTLLIHLGYLAYDSNTRKATIPNLEVADAFGDAVSGDGWAYVATAIQDSDDLLEATLEGDCEKVAEALEKTHESVASVLQYNNEASLSAAVILAYYTARRYYEIVHEMPAGKGFADLVFLPRRNTDFPAMIVELKYDKDADTAIRQIKEKRYDGRLREYFGNLIMVGINYDRNTRKHTCLIERPQAESTEQTMEKHSDANNNSANK
ncbi:MAG: ATP-binding protein [Lachnospiraceae bacterium]|nr:ATP-binding protein [Lachnospiraceae bacterium]